MAILVDSCVLIDACTPQSHTHDEAAKFLEELRRLGWRAVMPAHAWFEVQCACQRQIADGNSVEGIVNYPIALIHMDMDFINTYAKADIQYYKSGDHIFMAIAKIDGHVLVTYDAGMIEASKACGIRVFTPGELMGAPPSSSTLSAIARPLSQHPR
jgi:hypothetical protein